MLCLHAFADRPHFGQKNPNWNIGKNVGLSRAEPLDLLLKIVDKSLSYYDHVRITTESINKKEKRCSLTLSSEVLVKFCGFYHFKN